MTTIQIAVDTLKALSEQTLMHSVSLIDNSPHPSIDQGSAHLVTCCTAGERLDWHIQALDRYTPIALKEIAFFPIFEPVEDTPHSAVSASDSYEFANDPAQYHWAGYVPSHLAFGIRYHYQLTIQMGHGSQSTMTLDTPSIVRVSDACKSSTIHLV